MICQVCWAAGRLEILFMSHSSQSLSWGQELFSNLLYLHNLSHILFFSFQPVINIFLFCLFLLLHSVIFLFSFITTITFSFLFFFVKLLYFLSFFSFLFNFQLSFYYSTVFSKHFFHIISILKFLKSEPKRFFFRFSFMLVMFHLFFAYTLSLLGF